MSGNSDKTEAAARVTRSMRRMNSTESLNTDESRPETPTLRLKNAKKLDAISEGAVTPKRTTRANSATRNLIETNTPVASPLRRNTRRASQEPEVLRRSRRLSSTIESEDDDVVFVSVSQSAATPRAKKIITKLEEVLEEHPEIVAEKEINKSVDLNASDELELRNRSIAKSPSLSKVNSSPDKISLSQVIADLESPKASQENNANNTSVKNTPVKTSAEDKDTEQAEKGSVSPLNKSKRKSSLGTRTSERLNDSGYAKSSGLDESTSTRASTNIHTSPSSCRPARVVIERLSSDFLVSSTTKANNGDEEKEPAPDVESTVSELLIDFNSEPISNSEPTNVTEPKIQETDEKQNSDQTQLQPKDIDVSDGETESKINETTKQVVDMEITVPPVKSWSLPVSGQAKGIDTLVTESEEKEIIKSETKKAISSDESDDEDHEKNSFVDSQAEEMSGEEESLTESERKYMEENEVPDDGESLGSQDSNELDDEENESDVTNDSFINDDINVSDKYSLNSSEEELEKPKIKKKMRTIDSDSDEPKKPSPVKKPAPKFSDSENEIEQSPAKPREVPESVEDPVMETSIAKKSPNKSLQERKSDANEQQPTTEANIASENNNSDFDVSMVSPSKNSVTSENPVMKTSTTRKSNRKSKENNSESNVVEQPSFAKTRKLYTHVTEESPNIISPKRQSRGLIQSAQSSDDEKEKATQNTPVKNTVAESNSSDSDGSMQSSSKESEANESPAVNTSKSSTRKSLPKEKSEAQQPPAKNNKRRLDTSDDEIEEEIIASQKRQKRLTANESEAMHMEDVSQHLHKTEEKPQEFIENLLKRCSDYLEKTRSEKKEKMKLKKEQKAKKLEKKKLDLQQNGSFESNGDNKENSMKKKKKKSKNKKPKLVEEVETGKKDAMAERLQQLQEKLELKRQRKREKKLAKAAEKTKENTSEPEQPVAVKVEKKKKMKASVVESDVKSNENFSIKESAPSKKKTKDKKLEENVAEIVEKPEKAKKKKKTSESLDNQVEWKTQEVEKKIGKKRRLEEVTDVDDSISIKTHAKKKLNILKHVENSSQLLKNSSNENQPVPEFKLGPSVTSKLKKVIPKDLSEVSKKNKKKISGGKKQIPEPKVALPRPVWTSAGVFMEEPVSPYKFKPSKYIPTNSATQFSVISFEGNKKKKTVQEPQDYKTQLLFKRTKNVRDKSMKNIKKLI